MHRRNIRKPLNRDGSNLNGLIRRQLTAAGRHRAGLPIYVPTDQDQVFIHPRPARRIVPTHGRQSDKYSRGSANSQFNKENRFPARCEEASTQQPAVSSARACRRCTTCVLLASGTEATSSLADGSRSTEMRSEQNGNSMCGLSHRRKKRSPRRHWDRYNFVELIDTRDLCPRYDSSSFFFLFSFLFFLHACNPDVHCPASYCPSWREC